MLLGSKLSGSLLYEDVMYSMPIMRVAARQWRARRFVRRRRAFLGYTKSSTVLLTGVLLLIGLAGGGLSAVLECCVVWRYS